MIITIDGPAGSGKSTVAQRVAQQLWIYYLNTGMLYRAVAYLLFYDSAGIFKGNLDADISQLTREQLDALPKIEYSYSVAGAAVAVRGQDFTQQLFAIAGIDQLASRVSALPVVRAYLLDVQRDVAKKHDVIADGRDCGTVVFPQAEYKFYLTASVDVRASRRMRDAKTLALGLTFEQARADVAARDERDQNREIAPLRIPEGAVVIDASDLTIDQVVERVIEVVEA